MDRLPRLAALAIAAVAALGAAACAPPRTPPAYAPLSGSAPTTTPAAALRRGRVLARGVLGYAVAFLPDGGTASIELAGAFELVVRDPEQRERARIAVGEAGYDITALAVDTGGARALVASVDGSVTEFALDAGTALRRFRLGRRATAAAFVGARFLVTGDDQGVLCLRRAADGALLQCAVAHPARIASLDAARGRDGRWRIASASWDGDVAVWDAPSLRLRGRQAVGGAATDVAFSPSGRQLAASFAAAPPVRSPAVVERERRRGYPIPDRGTGAAVWQLDDFASREAPVRRCLGHAGPVTSLAWTIDERQLVTGSWDRTVRLWRIGGSGRDRHDCVEAARMSGFSGLVSAVATAPDGRFAAVATWLETLEQPAVWLLELLYPLHTARDQTLP